MFKILLVKTLFSKNLYWQKWRSLCTRMAEFDENQIPNSLLKRKPSEPKPEDCCGDGCKVCVYDIYEQEMKIWKNECYKFLGCEIIDDSPADQVDWISPLCYTPCTLKKIKPISRNSNLYRFMLPEKTKIHVKPGEHLIMRGEVNDEIFSRQYTPVTSSDNSFNVLIKIYEQGLLSHFISNLKEGCEVDWRGPFGLFPYTRNTHSKLVMLAAGTGIAPMIQVIKHILEDEMDETTIHLLFCCRFYDEILMKDLMNEWKQFWNFQVSFYLSQEKDRSNIKYGETVIFDRLSSSVLEKELPEVNQAKTRVLICGTKEFNHAMTTYLENLTFPMENVHIF